MPQWNNWHITFSPDIVRSFLSMWSESELCSVMLNAVDRRARQHPKPLAWDFVFPGHQSTVLPQALVCCELQPVAVSLYSHVIHLTWASVILVCHHNLKGCSNMYGCTSAVIQFFPDITALTTNTDHSFLKFTLLQGVCKNISCKSHSDLSTSKRFSASFGNYIWKLQPNFRICHLIHLFTKKIRLV